jgi:hypothetical protein
MSDQFQKLKPLPDEILNMTDKETACQYCGISYLLLSKYEKMTIHVQAMENELQGLKDYVRERPQLQEKIQVLLEFQSKALTRENDLEKELKESQKQLQWERSDLDLLKSKHSELQKQLVEQFIDCFQKDLTKNLIGTRNRSKRQAIKSSKGRKREDDSAIE